MQHGPGTPRNPSVGGDNWSSTVGGRSGGSSGGGGGNGGNGKSRGSGFAFFPWWIELPLATLALIVSTGVPI